MNAAPRRACVLDGVQCVPSRLHCSLWPRGFGRFDVTPFVVIEFAVFLLFQDIEAWVPPTPPGKVLLDSLAACAKVLFEGDGCESEGRGIAATRAADVLSRG